MNPLDRIEPVTDTFDEYDWSEFRLVHKDNAELRELLRRAVERAERLQVEWRQLLKSQDEIIAIGRKILESPPATAEERPPEPFEDAT